jgi:hypothetical protein
MASMLVAEVLTNNLAQRAVLAVSEAPNLDMAIGRLAAVLHQNFFPLRIDVGLRVGDDRLVICGLWTARQTRLKQGTVLRVGATGFPNLVEQKGVVLSAEVPTNPAAEVLEEEDLHAWVAIPIPSENVIEGGLGLCAQSDVFTGHRGFFSLLGAEVGERLAQLAHESEPYLHARKTLLESDGE